MKRFVAISLALSMLGVGALSACATASEERDEYERVQDIRIEFDDGTGADGDKLLYKNEVTTEGPDPQVFYVSDEESTEYGYYYLVSTNNFVLYRSRDLVTWENASKLYADKIGQDRAYVPEEEDYGEFNFWAPEVVYDSETDKYYMYYSASISESSRYANELEPGAGYIGVLEADEPYGPYINTTHKWLFNNRLLSAILREKFPNRFTSNYTTVAGIDANPFVDPATGEKYLNFVSEPINTIGQESCIFQIRMKDWTTPDYTASSVTQLTRCGYVSADPTDDEMSRGEWYRINEGPCMYARRQEDGGYRYYLTFSVNNYATANYSVLQAVADSVQGPFTKLQPEEGGILMTAVRRDENSGKGYNKIVDNVSGPGHHCLVERDGKLYMIYHQHLDPNYDGGIPILRGFATDEVVFVRNNAGEEIMALNGPTKNLQPVPEFASGYRNIAPEAELTVSDGQDGSLLKDGAIAYYEWATWIKELESKKTVTVTLDFGTYRSVRSILVYNSSDFSKAFDEISQISLEYRDEETKTEGRGYLQEVGFDWEANSFGEEMRPCGAAIAVLKKDYLVRSIEITLNIPDRMVGGVVQSAIALSEIKVLGL